MIESYFDARITEVTSAAALFTVAIQRPSAPDKYGDFTGFTDSTINCRYVPSAERFLGKNVQGEDETLISRAILYVKTTEDIEVGDKVKIQYNGTLRVSGESPIHHELLTVRRKEALKDFTIQGWKVYLT